MENQIAFEKDMLENVLIFDTETTGLIGKGLTYEKDYDQFPRVVQIAWYLNGVHKNFIVKPDGYQIPSTATDIHGITTEYALEHGTPFHVVANEFIRDCLKAKNILGHNIYFDTSIIKANIMRLNMSMFFMIAEIALHKSKRIDMMRATTKFVGALQANGKSPKFPTLEELHFKLFERNFPAHKADEDVKASLRCAEVLFKDEILMLREPENVSFKDEFLKYVYG